MSNLHKLIKFVPSCREQSTYSSINVCNCHRSSFQNYFHEKLLLVMQVSFPVGMQLFRAKWTQVKSFFTKYKYRKSRLCNNYKQMFPGFKVLLTDS